MLASVVGINPSSFQYEAKLISTAKALYAADQHYIESCKAWINGGGMPPGFYPPSDPGSGGGGGGGGGGTGVGGGSVLVPGGYWEYVPETSDIVAPGLGEIQVVGTSTLAGC